METATRTAIPGGIDLLSAATAGDELAFRRIVAAHHEDMRRVCLCVTHDASVTDEAVQSAWALAWRKQELAHPSAAGFAAAASLADIYQAMADAGRASREASNDAGVELDMSGPIAVETTYSLQPADPGHRLRWHVNHGPVIVTVTTGTLTFVDDTCQTFDLVAGQSYIEPTGQVLGAMLLPEKNPGGAAVGWFTTRLSPEWAAGPVEVDAPCVM